MESEQNGTHACTGCNTDTDDAVSAALRAQLDRVLDELWAIGDDDRTSTGISVTIAKLAMRLCRLYPAGAAPTQCVALQTCTLELYDREAKLEHERVPMTRREAALLHYLLMNRERVVSRGELMRKVWGKWLDGPAARTVDIHVHRLRSKLGQEFAERVETIRHVGYRFSSQPNTQRRRARASGGQPTASVQL